MAQKEFTIYTGVRYEKVTGKEILSPSGQPTGHYDITSHSTTSVFGLLDDEEEKKKFTQELTKYLTTIWNRPYNFVVQSEQYFFTINRNSSTATPAKNRYATIFLILLDIIQQIGYLQSYVFTPTHLELTLVDKNAPNREVFTMTFTPYDTQTYVYTTWG